MVLKSWYFLLFFLASCAVNNGPLTNNFVYKVIPAGSFEIATWQKISDSVNPIHVYIEGDGRSFDGAGRPTLDPTPKGTFLRDLVEKDLSSNVVYMARPCQFVMSDNCNQHDWTDGRFSSKVIEAMTLAIKEISNGQDVILIGYSGGALVSGLIIQKNQDLNVKKWITIAGVLNHNDWTEYFNDSPLLLSMSLDELPKVSQIHYVAEYDDVVPISLTKKVVDIENMVVIPNATHDNFENFKIDFFI